MTALLGERTADVIGAAQQLLTGRMGVPVNLVDCVELGGSDRTIVLRARVAEHAYSLPRTVIVKKVRESAEEQDQASTDSSGHDSAFLREAASYQFATALALRDRPGPELLALDLDRQILILSDLGEDGKLPSLLAKSDDTATRSLMAYAQGLGRMHANTVGREGDFTALLRRAGVVHRSDAVNGQVAKAVREVPVLLRDQLGVEVSVDLVDMVADRMRLFDGGRFRAFSPSDMCPDNIIVNDDGARFVDYEWGGFRDATLDIAYALVSFPQCLCHLPLTRDRAESMIEAWRAEVVGIWPQLADDTTLARKILDAQLVWVWLTTFWFLPDDHDRIASVRDHGMSVPRSRALTARWSGLCLLYTSPSPRD